MENQQSTYKYYNFSYASGALQTIDIPADLTARGVKIVNTLVAENTNFITLTAASDTLTDVVILNQIAIPRGAVLVLNEDDLGFQKNIGYSLKFKMSLAAGTIGVTLKF